MSVLDLWVLEAPIEQNYQCVVPSRIRSDLARGYIACAVVDWFSNGACHTLALALHDLTGLPIGATENHAYVEDINRTVIDITGKRFCWDVSPMNRTDYRTFLDWGYNHPQNIDAARVAAQLTQESLREFRY
jgi:hypothetical protein